MGFENKPSNTATPATTPQTVADSAKSAQLAVVEKNISDAVFNRVNSLTEAGRLNLPADYSIGNAMSSAWLRIIRTKDRNGRPALEVCTRESVTNTLLEMAILGLSMAKDQCYPIVYGTELTCFVSVHGKMAAISRLKGVESQPVARSSSRATKWKSVLPTKAKWKSSRTKPRGRTSKKARSPAHTLPSSTKGRSAPPSFR